MRDNDRPTRPGHKPLAGLAIEVAGISKRIYLLTVAHIGQGEVQPVFLFVDVNNGVLTMISGFVNESLRTGNPSGYPGIYRNPHYAYPVAILTTPVFTFHAHLSVRMCPGGNTVAGVHRYLRSVAE